MTDIINHNSEFNADGSQHLGQVQDDSKTQGLVDTIGGEFGWGDRTDEVVQQVMSNDEFKNAIRYLNHALQASQDVPITRQVRACGEIRLMGLFLPLNTPVRIVRENYNRTRMLVSGPATANVWAANDPNMVNAGTGVPMPNAAQIGYLGATWSREFNTIREVWVYADVACVISVQEEWIA